MVYNDKKFIGNIIKQARQKKSLSQCALAEQVGLSEKHVSNIERGLNFPSLDTFFKLCEVLNLSLENFGVNINKSLSSVQQELLSKILCASDTDIKAYNNSIDFINNLKILYKR